MGVSEYLRETAERMRLETRIQKTRTLHINSANRSFSFETFDNDASFAQAKATLQGQTYPPIPFLTDVVSVLDIGANIGASAVTFAIRYPGARIVAVEPSRLASILLRCNTSAHANIECYNVGLFHTTMKRQLYLGGSDSVTNSVVQNALSSPLQEEIQLLAADAFAAEVGVTHPDIIKIDTEGCELPIISSMVDSFRGAKAVYLEYHSESDRLAIDKALTDTHILFFGRIPFPHRGELVYVRKDAFPTLKERDLWRIGN